MYLELYKHTFIDKIFLCACQQKRECKNNVDAFVMIK